MSVDEFPDRIAKREGIGREEALEHTRAVFAALGEVITGAEFSDMAAEPPGEYAPLMAAPAG